MTRAGLFLTLLLPLGLAAEQERLSDQEWLDALLRAEQAQKAQPPSDDTLSPFTQDGHPAPLYLPFMPPGTDWRLTESRLSGGEETWIWRQKWGRAHRQLSLTRAPVSSEKPLAVRHSLHHNSTMLRCLDARETPVRRDNVGELVRWQWQAHCMEKHGGRLTQRFLLLRHGNHRYDLIMEWHDKAPDKAEKRLWEQRFEAVRACPAKDQCRLTP